MSQPTVRLCGVALPGGGTVVLSDVSPGGIVPRVALALDATPTNPPHLDPDCAGALGESLLTWAIKQGYEPHPSTQIARWNLPDVDTLAVLIERAVFGEEAPLDNLGRYAAALRTARAIASALPEVLGLLEELNPAPAEEAAEAMVWAWPQASHGRFDFGIVPTRSFTNANGLTETFVFRFPADLASTRMLGAEVLTSPCDGCDYVQVGQVTELRQHDEDTAELVLTIGTALPSDPLRAEPSIPTHDLDRMLEHLVNEWGALGVAHKAAETVPDEDQSRWVRSLAARLAEKHTGPTFDAPDMPDEDHLADALVDAARTSRPSVPLAPMPTVRDLGLVLDTVEAYERDAETWDGQVSDATSRLRVSFDAAIAARADFLDQLDGRPEPEDLVEDEDGAPLPPSVQTLITSAERVTAAVNDDTVPALLRAVDGLAVSVARVRMESRR